MVVYAFTMVFSFFSDDILLYSAYFVAAYYVVECIVFFGCKKFSFCTFLVFRIMCMLYDTGFAIYYCFIDWDKYEYGGLGITVIPLLFISTGLSIAITVLYSKLPGIGKCCPTVRSQPEQAQIYLQPGQIITLPNGQQVICVTSIPQDGGATSNTVAQN